MGLAVPHLERLGIREVLSAPRSPWQRAYVERVIGSIRRECLDHMIVFHESSLRRTLSCYFQYYHQSRTHLSLGKDSPEPRSIQPPEMGRVVAVPQVGGLTARYSGARPTWRRSYSISKVIIMSIERTPDAKGTRR